MRLKIRRATHTQLCTHRPKLGPLGPLGPLRTADCTSTSEKTADRLTKLCPLPLRRVVTLVGSAFELMCRFDEKTWIFELYFQFETIPACLWILYVNFSTPGCFHSLTRPNQNRARKNRLRKEAYKKKTARALHGV